MKNTSVNLENMLRLFEVLFVGSVGLYLFYTQNRLLDAQNSLVRASNSLQEQLVQKAEPVRLLIRGTKDGSLELMNLSRVPVVLAEIRALQFVYPKTNKSQGICVARPEVISELVIDEIQPFHSKPIKHELGACTFPSGPSESAIQVTITALNGKTFEQKGPFVFFFKKNRDGSLVSSHDLGRIENGRFVWSNEEDQNVFALFADHLSKMAVDEVRITNAIVPPEQPFGGLGIDAAVRR